MTTAQDIVDSGLGRLGALPKGEEPKQYDRDKIFDVLIDLIAMLSAKSILLPYRTKESFSLAAGVSSVTIGSTGDLVTALPHRIDSIVIRDSNDDDYILSKMTRRKYNESFDPSLFTLRPTEYHYETSHPDGTILFDYKTADAETILITSIKEVLPPINLAANIDLPAEYIALLKFNLPVFASDLFPENNLTQITIGLANSSIKMIENKNLANRIPSSKVDKALQLYGGQRYNVNED
jgi:hypothetical protein